MGKFTVIGVLDVTILRGRQTFEVALRTDKGQTKLVIPADQLGLLITNLESLEHHASLLDPVSQS